MRAFVIAMENEAEQVRPFLRDGDRLYVSGVGKVGKTPFEGSNVLYFELADGSSFIVRPSGTEPKIKVYVLCRGENREECDERTARYAAFAEELSK